MPVLLAGCSSSDSPANAATSSAGTSQSSAAATSAATDADATRAQGAMDEAVARISAVEPPAEATPQWTRLVTAWTAMRYLPAQADLTNPQANTDLTHPAAGAADRAGRLPHRGRRLRQRQLLTGPA